MDKQSRTANHLFLAFIIGYIFYRSQIVFPQLYQYFGNSVFWTFVIIAALQPFYLAFLTKAFEKVRIFSLQKLVENNSTKVIYIINKISLTLYFLFNFAFLIFANTSLYTTYYYQNVPFIIFIVIFVSLTIYGTSYGLKSLTRISVLMAIITIFTTLFYFMAPSEIKWFTLAFKWPEAIKENALLAIIFAILVYIVEPITFLLISDYSSTRFDARKVFFISFLFTLISIYNISRQNWEFGILLKYLRFPFFESWRNFNFDPYIRQLDFLIIIYYFGSQYQRLLYGTTLINKIWSLKKPYFALIILATSGGIAHLMINNTFLYQKYSLPLFIAMISMLSIAALLTLINVFKGGKKNVSKENTI